MVISLTIGLAILQVYTGGSWEAEDCFHRAVYVFICMNKACTGGRDGLVIKKQKIRLIY